MVHRFCRPILSADFVGQLNHAHKIRPTVIRLTSPLMLAYNIPGHVYVDTLYFSGQSTYRATSHVNSTKWGAHTVYHC